MTNEEHIEQLKKLRSFHNGSYGRSINKAIEALEAIDNIKAEIKSLIDMCDTDYEFEEILAYKIVLEIVDKHIGKE